MLGWLGVATANMVAGNSVTDAQLAAKQAELAALSTQVSVMKSDVNALKGNVATTAAKIEARQQFLATLLTGKRDLAQLAAMLPRADAGGDALVTAAELLPVKGKRGKNAQINPALAEAAVLEPFRKLESQQLAFVDTATNAAQARLKETQTLVRRLGLDPDRLIAQSATGMGGPYIPANSEELTGAEPRFKDLYLSWKKLTTLEAALVSIPAFAPVANYSLTSGFGYRYDPFNGGAAMHAGLDMAGSQGEPIYAAAAGVVGVAGRSGGYGNLIELEHGRGMATRYGHLSAILVQPGETVKQGQLIGRMGSTGRSTGTHLHYEVRIDGRAVNPRPYLAASSYVLAAQSRAVQGATESGTAVAASSFTGQSFTAGIGGR
ncbi:M23 family metallopeptidase [Polymorphobacter arshaanensis]|uniref:M23 family metallopeptidase n=1 Tax=Glacieibacterium arshaanense TaxID=2511025 RepID=UPI001407B9BF|nr:M23 family metallopeptidase [Polymorphobacter arshaanensis]